MLINEIDLTALGRFFWPTALRPNGYTAAQSVGQVRLRKILLRAAHPLFSQKLYASLLSNTIQKQNDNSKQTLGK